ncbi:restriction endonuclease subunit S [Paenibacillus chitinolyticus]|uniref:restriction endonuclease subunit S n=1 Tax=Paenibacillus chitinolyticus TaxID=79263 RepID=UPI003559029B
MGNKSKPEIQFPGFIEEWEKRELRGFVQDYIERTVVQNQYPVLTSSQKRGIIYQEEYFADRQITTQENIGYFVLPRGYFTFRSRSDNGVFKFNRNDLVDKGIISYFYPVFKIINGNSDFFLNMLNSTIKKQVALEAEGTGQKVLSLNKFKNINVVIPEIQEQTQIGNFFKQLDDTITFYEQELTTLQQTKQGFLQKMFPKEGESVPEVRFPGFAGDWEQRSLKEVTKKIGSGKTPKGGSSNYKLQGIPLLRSQNIFNDKVNLLDVVYISEEVDEDMANSRVQQNDVLLNITGASIGRSAVYEFETSANVNQHVSIIRPYENVNPYFIQLNLTSGNGQNQIEFNQAGGGREGLNFQQISKMKFYFPNLKEQVRIAGFFKKLDQVISIHQRELELLKQTQKAFLQKMFV